MVIMDTSFLILLFVIFVFVWVITNYWTYRGCRREYRELLRTKQQLEQELSDEKIKAAKILSQKKSSEVRTGMVVEKMAPFLENFPFEPNRCHFLGRPIDFIVFNEDSIDFVEVKSGNASLTSSQKQIKKLIEERKVTFHTFTVNGE